MARWMDHQEGNREVYPENHAGFFYGPTGWIKLEERLSSAEQAERIRAVVSADQQASRREKAWRRRARLRLGGQR